MHELLRKSAKDFNINSLGCSNIERYVSLLKKWNSAYRLVGDAHDQVIYERHIADSLAVLPQLEGVKRLLDMGCGAGLPGLVLRIAKPELHLYLLDSLAKRTRFCQAVVRELALENVEVWHARAEDLDCVSRFASVGRGDCIISRATWSLVDFLRIVNLYQCSGLRVIAMKGPGWESELQAVHDCGEELSCYESPEVSQYVLPGSGRERFLLTYDL